MSGYHHFLDKTIQYTVYSIILVCLGNFQINVLKYIDKIEGVPWLIVKWG